MANGIRTGDLRGLNKGRSSKFRQGFRFRQTPEEGWKTYRPKRCGNNDKDKDNSPKTLNDKKYLLLFYNFIKIYMLKQKKKINILNWKERKEVWVRWPENNQYKSTKELSRWM